MGEVVVGVALGTFKSKHVLGGAVPVRSGYSRNFTPTKRVFNMVVIIPTAKPNAIDYNVPVVPHKAVAEVSE